MEKSRFGIKVCLLGALSYWLTLVGGFIPALLICGYVLLFESSQWLKKTCLNALMLSVFIAVISYAISVFPDVVGFIDSFFGIFEGHFYANAFNSFISVLRYILSIVETIMLIVLGFTSLKQKDITIPVVSKFVNKYFVDGLQAVTEKEHTNEVE